MFESQSRRSDFIVEDFHNRPGHRPAPMPGKRQTIDPQSAMRTRIEGAGSGSAGSTPGSGEADRGAADGAVSAIRIRRNQGYQSTGMRRLVEADARVCDTGRSGGGRQRAVESFGPNDSRR
jgi:hypothetical protein